MSDEHELAAWCSKYPWFHGVYASDELPEPSALPPGAAVIVNYIDREAGKTGHWCAILHVGDKQQRPAFFDSFAFQPDGLDQILQTRTHFEPWMQRASKLAGHHGEYDYNHESLQCVTTDSCGHYACWAVKVNCLPQNEDGVLRHAWLPVSEAQPQRSQRLLPQARWGTTSATATRPATGITAGKQATKVGVLTG